MMVWVSATMLIDDREILAVDSRNAGLFPHGVCAGIGVIPIHGDVGGTGPQRGEYSDVQISGA